MDAGDVLQTTVLVFFESLTNDGTINFIDGGAVVQLAFLNDGSINITNNRLRLHTRATSENNGTINVNSFGILEIFPDTTVLTNNNTIIINAGGNLNNLGTVDNKNVIQLNCGGSITGNPITGNPVQDNCPPSVTIDQSAGQADPTNTSPINFTAVFSEPVTGFTSADVTLSGTAGATTAVVSEIAPTTYTVAVSGMTGNGTVIASVPAGGATDAAENSNTASTSADNTVVFDQTAPGVACSVSPNTLQPPNHRLRPISATVTVTDASAGPAGFTLVSVTSNEPDSGLDAEDVPNDIQGWTLNTPDISGQLRAERSGAGSGRRYMLTYRGLDEAGNAANCSATVTVPRGKR